RRKLFGRLCSRILSGAFPPRFLPSLLDVRLCGSSAACDHLRKAAGRASLIQLRAPIHLFFSLIRPMQTAAVLTFLHRRLAVIFSLMQHEELEQQLHREGFAIIPSCLDEDTVDDLRAEFSESRESQRNALDNPSIRQLAVSAPVREIMESALGQNCFAVRSIFFNKTKEANWKVVWHQDLTISV